MIVEGDVYSLAIRDNEDENTFAPLDLFDWLGIISKLREEGLTQEKIGEKMGWSRGQVSQHFMLLDKIATAILDLCKIHQSGRVAQIATVVAFDFSEGWFRNYFSKNY